MPRLSYKGFSYQIFQYFFQELLGWVRLNWKIKYIYLSSIYLSIITKSNEIDFEN